MSSLPSRQDNDHNDTPDHAMATLDTPVDLVIRFSTSNPDILLPISHPSNTTGLSLKQQIRSHLDAPSSESRLRLIHAGKVLQDTVALSKSLNIPHPPPPPRDNDTKSGNSKAKGKQPVRNDTKPASAVRVYIHCSLGDVLTATELAQEAKQAQEADHALLSQTTTSLPTSAEGSTSDTSTTTPAPRGFDRLLTAAFTPAEVTALRAQFLAIQSHSHTPDTMPTGPDLLALEERWLDSGSSPNIAPGDADAGGFVGEDAGGLEDMLYGNLIGFFWPIGGVCWLMREEGVWSRRKQVAVLSGFLVNLGFGVLRVMS